jgi:hypothetical protein
MAGWFRRRASGARLPHPQLPDTLSPKIARALLTGQQAAKLPA